MLANRPVCNTQQVDMYIYRPTDQFVPHDKCIGIFTGLHTSVYYMTAVYVYIYTCLQIRCVPHDCIICIYAGLHSSVYNTTGGHVSIKNYRSVCTTRHVNMHLHRPTDQCVPHDRWTCIYTDLQTSVYHMTAVYVTIMVYRPACTA